MYLLFFVNDYVQVNQKGVPTPPPKKKLFFDMRIMLEKRLFSSSFGKF